MADLHAASFEGADVGRGWSEKEFAALMAEETVFLCDAPGADRTGVDGAGFALGRAVAGEAELLTLAVAPHAQRRGLGRALLAAFEEEALERRAEIAFLEVAETNSAARSLYEAAGYAERGRRKGYYARQGADAVDALVLSKMLRA